MPQDPLSSEVVELDEAVVIRLRGSITEESALVQELAGLQDRNVIIDASGILRINSCGVREWVRWVNALGARGNRLYLMKCSTAVVAQLNMISSFGGRGLVVSVLAPYACASCHITRDERLPIAGVGTSLQVPESTCPNCRQRMEFDDDPTLYLDFAQSHVGRSVPEEMKKVISRLE